MRKKLGLKVILAEMEASQRIDFTWDIWGTPGRPPKAVSFCMFAFLPSLSCLEWALYTLVF